MHIALSQIVADLSQIFAHQLLLWAQQEQDIPGKPQLFASSSMSTPWSWASTQEQSRTLEVAAILATQPVLLSSQLLVPSLTVFVDHTKQPSE